MTKALGLQDTTPLHQKLNDARDWVQLEGADNWFVGGVLGGICDVLNSIILWLPGADRDPGVPASGARDRVARRRRPGGLDHLRVRRAALDDPGHRYDAVLRHRRPVVGQHGHAHHHAARGPGLHHRRHPAGHLDGPEQGRLRRASRRSSTSCRPFPPFCYLAPLALFFGIGSAVRAGADDHLRAAADRADHRARHPLGLAHDDRGRPVPGPDPRPDAAPGAAADGRAAPSWSASTSA